MEIRHKTNQYQHYRIEIVHKNLPGHTTALYSGELKIGLLYYLSYKAFAVVERNPSKSQ